MQFGCIWTVYMMNFYSAIDSDKSEYVVSVDGVATLGERVVDAFYVVVDDEDIVVAFRDFFVWILEAEGFRRLCSTVLLCCYVVVAFFYVFFDQLVYIQFFIDNLFVEVGHLFESHTFQQMVQDAVVNVDFLVAELPFEDFFCVLPLLHLRLLESQLYFGACLACHDKLEPVALWCLVALGQYLYFVP